MFSAFLWPFGEAPVLWGNNFWHSVLDGSLASPEYSTAMDLSNALPLFEVGAGVTKKVFPFGEMVVYRCTESMLVPDAAAAAILGCASRYVYIGAWVRAGAGSGA